MIKHIFKLLPLVLLVSGCNGVIPGGNTQVSSGRDVSRSEILRRGDPNSTQKALVIGNSTYEYSSLRNPVNDARSMTTQLVKMGFDVTLATDLNDDNMTKAVKAFGELLSKTPNGSVALFYFSGHGAQVDGRNFLIPTNNNDLHGETELKKVALDTQTILAMMEKNNAGMNFLILDACRDNPYQGSEKNLSRGLARVEPPRGALVAFATASGEIAKDGDGLHGVYTGHLLKALSNAQHKRIEDVFMNVRNAVSSETAEKQKPWYRASLTKPFCFGGCR